MTRTLARYRGERIEGMPLASLRRKLGKNDLTKSAAEWLSHLQHDPWSSSWRGQAAQKVGHSAHLPIGSRDCTGWHVSIPHICLCCSPRKPHRIRNSCAPVLEKYERYAVYQ